MGDKIVYLASSEVGHVTSDGTVSAPVGGGEVLEYVKPNHDTGPQFIDWVLQGQFNNIPIVKIIIIGLIILIATLIILRMFRVRSVRWGKGIRNEVASVSEQRKQDKVIINVNSFMLWLTNKVEASIFKSSDIEREHRQYLLKRADVMVGGFREMTPEEYNALVRFAQLIVVIVALIMAFNQLRLVSFMLLVFGTNACSMVPNFFIRAKVTTRNKEIQKNFPDLYLMMHYGLVMGGSEPIDKTMKSYTRTTDSPIMVNFVDNCCQIIDTYGAYASMQKIADEYKEIYEVGKMTRLVSQLYGGGDVVKDLEGFRDELMEMKRREIEAYTNKLIAKGKISVNIIFVVLFQAVISGFSVYMKDILGGASMFTGK